MEPALQPLTWQECWRMLPPGFFGGMGFVLGAIVGSFLNVCIHRMPRGESIVFPGSHCGACGKPVRWHDNLPLLSYWILGGKCRDCGARFSIRYWLVELFTALLFAWIWLRFPPLPALAYSVFAGGLVAATFIDFEHYIIPDEITWGGVAAGLLFSAAIPALQGELLVWKAALWSAAGAALGFGALFLVVEAGKRVFGVKKIALPAPAAVALSEKGIRIESETDLWQDIFSRESDVLSFEAEKVKRGEREWPQALVEVTWKEIRVAGEAFPLEGFEGELTATAQVISVPREAMGFGDVKFLAAIGAFLGPAAIFFVVLVSSVVGSAVGLTVMLAGRREWGVKIPYGPYLALGALVWIFGGSGWAEAYFHWMRHP